MNPLVVLLQAEGQQSPFGMLVPMAAIFLIFYFLLIRPQQKRQKEHDEMLASIEKGDEVVTSGGIHGKVVGTTDDTLTLDIGAVKGERIKIKCARSKIDARHKGGES